MPLTTALVATIEDKKQISQVVKLLAEKFPLDKEYLFLKRVKADKGGLISKAIFIFVYSQQKIKKSLYSTYFSQ